MRVSIYVEFTVWGEHCYPEATREDIKRKHLHFFLFRIEFPEYGDREVEWLDFKEKVVKRLAEDFKRKDKYYFGMLSCEHIAIEVAKIVSEFVYDRPVTITVSEYDKMCGAIVEFNEFEMRRYHEPTQISIAM